MLPAGEKAVGAPGPVHRERCSGWWALVGRRPDHSGDRQGTPVWIERGCLRAQAVSPGAIRHLDLGLCHGPWEVT